MAWGSPGQRCVRVGWKRFGCSLKRPGAAWPLDNVVSQDERGRGLQLPCPRRSRDITDKCEQVRVGLFPRGRWGRPSPAVSWLECPGLPSDAGPGPAAGNFVPPYPLPLSPHPESPLGHRDAERRLLQTWGLRILTATKSPITSGFCSESFVPTLTTNLTPGMGFVFRKALLRQDTSPQLVPTSFLA